MLPARSEKLLQDTKNVHDSLVMRKRSRQPGVYIVLSIAIIGLFIARARKPSTLAVPSYQSAATEVTPLPITNTFVDRLFGTIIFYRGSDLIALTLPTREEHVIVGVAAQTAVPVSTKFAPVWSPDGKLLVLRRDTSIVVTQFDTGKFIGNFPLKNTDAAESATISIDPASEVLALSESSASESSLHFYSLQTQKEIGVYPRCQGNGVWMTGVGYVTKCTLGDTLSLELVRFEPSSSVLTPLLRENTTTKYQLIDEYRPGLVLLKKTTSGTDSLITIDANGKTTVIPKSEYAKAPSIDSLVHATDFLRERIQKETGIQGVRDLAVAKDNSFVVFSTSEGIYVATLDLKEKPFFLGKGELPRVRPE